MKKEKILDIYNLKEAFYSYICGPTLYKEVHIGNIRPIIFFDTLKTVVEYYFKVKFHLIINFTDIDKKIITAFQKEEMTYSTFIKKYLYKTLKLFSLFKLEFFLNPRTSQYLILIENFIKDLLLKKKAYILRDGIYFKVSESFFSLSKNKSSQLLMSKKNLNKRIDFALWKFRSKPEFGFISSLGYGIPGWHIECVVMCRENLPLHLKFLDFHVGGIDLLFPHHENENLLFSFLQNSLVVKRWFHLGLINFKNNKISKTNLNLQFLVVNLLKVYSVQELRFFLLRKYFNKTINFSFLLLKESSLQLKKLSLYLRKKTKNEKKKVLLSFSNFKELTFFTQNLIEIFLNTGNLQLVLSKLYLAFKRNKKINYSEILIFFKKIKIIL